MTSIELIEYERITYIKGMDDYLKRLKSMPKSEAVQLARTNLQKCHIIDENGEFTERYEYSKLNSKNNGKKYV
jgi:hypothetical protein